MVVASVIFARRLPSLRAVLMGYFKTVHGITVPAFFPDDSVASALAYEPREDDVFIVTYPKCGTTWVQYITYAILHNGDPPNGVPEFLTNSPFLEVFGADAVCAMPRPGIIKTHLAFNKLKFSSRAKYMYVARNPYDVCVSAYHHIRTLTACEEDLIDIDEFVKRFVSGGGHGCYLGDSLVPWYSRKNVGNVLFLTYEGLHADTKQQVKRVAEFLGREYGRRLSTDPALLQRIVELSTKERMRPFLKGFVRKNIEFVVEQRTSRNLQIATELQKLLEFVTHHPPRHEFMRDGSVGGYTKFLCENNRAILKDWIAAKTSGSDVMRLWPDVGV
ncbi:sulfotransferase 1C2-like [Rhipicephalus sanguineus]|uniref:sulfotransferase 1C2-like n=1 Tax=Rhipicephalus sanguineus TaxID=34632 RepID=UPI001896352B|nr:sulfotransferase 1C2-like [Rhipicephalus sanguineus]